MNSPKRHDGYELIAFDECVGIPDEALKAFEFALRSIRRSEPAAGNSPELGPDPFCPHGWWRGELCKSCQKP